MDEAKKFHLRPELRSEMQGPRTQPRLGLFLHTSVHHLIGRVFLFVCKSRIKLAYSLFSHKYVDT